MPVHVHGASIGLPQIIRREDFCRASGQARPMILQGKGKLRVLRLQVQSKNRDMQLFEPADQVCRIAVPGRKTEIGAQGHDPFKGLD